MITDWTTQHADRHTQLMIDTRDVNEESSKDGAHNVSSMHSPKGQWIGIKLYAIVQGHMIYSKEYREVEDVMMEIVHTLLAQLVNQRLGEVCSELRLPGSLSSKEPQITRI